MALDIAVAPCQGVESIPLVIGRFPRTPRGTPNSGNTVGKPEITAAKSISVKSGTNPGHQRGVGTLVPVAPWQRRG